jgi:K+ transporter
MKCKRMSLRATFGAVGVVFGDTGTSPHYALEQSRNVTGADRLTPAVVFGVLSIIFRSLLIVVAWIQRRGTKAVEFLRRPDKRVIVLATQAQL